MDISHLITPYKYGRPVLTGSGVKGSYDERAVDCPTVFSHNGRFYLMHVGYDGKGYQTGLAVSDDLIHWQKKGVILPRTGSDSWDGVGKAATTVLMDNDLYSGNRIKKWNGKYWLMYHSYPGTGYESGAAEFGLAWTEDEELMDWHCLKEPVFSWRNGAPWERGGLYKLSLFCKTDGKFMLFYNAKDVTKGNWTEQIGAACSDDLIHWQRISDKPVLPVTKGAWDSRFASDPQVMFDSAKKQYVMFYFGLGNLSACDGVAVSSDLIHWVKFPAPILTIGGRGTIDEKYAHKPYVIFHEGVLYHFYCACRYHQDGDITHFGDEFRCISVATSVPV